jgi:D-inositol-3-phosphate glycosyltransferase
MDLGLPEDATVLVCMAAICPRKGQSSLVQAFSAVASKHRDAILVLLGESDAYNRGWPEYVPAIREFAERAGISDRLRIEETTPDPYPWYLASDVMVCASDLESLPKTVLEGMAFERPVLATSVFGIPELIDDGLTGYLCEPRDAASLIGGLDRVLSATDAARETVAKAGARLVRSRHDPDQYADHVQRLLTVLAADGGAHPQALRETARG